MYRVQDFEVQWAEGKLPGWTKEKPTRPATIAAVSLDLSNYNSVEELEALGLERLKSALMALSMKCGGYDVPFHHHLVDGIRL